MVICAETELYYVTLGAKGAEITDYDYSQVNWVGYDKQTEGKKERRKKIWHH
jgi:hypothetical protein